MIRHSACDRSHILLPSLSTRDDPAKLLRTNTQKSPSTPNRMAEPQEETPKGGAQDAAQEKVAEKQKDGGKKDIHFFLPIPLQTPQRIYNLTKNSHTFTIDLQARAGTPLPKDTATQRARRSKTPLAKSANRSAKGCPTASSRWGTSSTPWSAA